MILSNVKQTERRLLLVAFLFYLFIATQIPYTLDDWNWGIDAGIKSFITADQNSRYAGNLVVILLTRSRILKAIVMATAFTFIPHIISLLSCDKDDNHYLIVYLLSNILMLLMPSYIWRETYGWVSGFANYVVSLFFLLGHIYMLHKDILQNDVVTTLPSSLGNKALVFVFAVVGQLFTENLAVYFVVVYLVALIYLTITKQRNRYVTIAFVGICVGTILMFSSGIYDTLLATGSAYDGTRQIAFDLNAGIVDILLSIAHKFAYYFVLQSTIYFHPQTVIILVCTTILLFQHKSKFSKLLILGNLGLSFVYILVWGIGLFIPFRYRIAVGLCYYLTILVELLYLFRSKPQKCLFIAFTWLSVYGILAPLSVTNSGVARLLLAPYVLVNLVVLNLLLEILQHFPFRKILVLSLCAIAIVFMGKYTWIYNSIGYTDRVRYASIDNAVSQNTAEVFLKEQKYKEFLYGPNPISDDTPMKEKWLRDYKLFYGIPEEYTIFITE